MPKNYKRNQLVRAYLFYANLGVQSVSSGLHRGIDLVCHACYRVARLVYLLHETVYGGVQLVDGLVGVLEDSLDGTHHVLVEFLRGLVERTNCILQGKTSVYLTEVFQPIINKIEELSNYKYGDDEEKDKRIEKENERVGAWSYNPIARNKKTCCRALLL